MHGVSSSVTLHKIKKQYLKSKLVDGKKWNKQTKKIKNSKEG